jgi:hypothetical protein
MIIAAGAALVYSRCAIRFETSSRKSQKHLYRSTVDAGTGGNLHLDDPLASELFCMRAEQVGRIELVRVVR